MPAHECLSFSLDGKSDLSTLIDRLHSLRSVVYPILLFPTFLVLVALLFRLWRIPFKMSTASIIGNKMLRDVVVSFGGIVKWLKPVPTDDVLNVITVSDRPNDPFNMEFGFVGSIIA